MQLANHLNEVFSTDDRMGRVESLIVRDEKDVDGLVSFFADDTANLVDYGIQDSQYMHNFWSEHYSKGSYWTVYPADKISVSVSGDLAYLIFGAEYTRLVEEEAKTGNKFYSVQVWKKQADGTWKIVAFK